MSIRQAFFFGRLRIFDLRGSTFFREALLWGIYTTLFTYLINLIALHLYANKNESAIIFINFSRVFAMRFVKRIFLFLVVNFLVLITISVVLNILGVKPYLNQYGINYRDLFIFCLAWGMGGALISLSLSKKMAKWMMRVKVIDPNTQDVRERELLHLVGHLSQKAHLPKVPEVGIYQAAEVNAFATGPTKSRSLVAVSTGLLEQMTPDQIEGVLAHEITHISNGDMVTMTLIQGVMNAFVMFLARVLALVLSGFGRGDRRGSFGSYYLLVILFDVLFMLLGSMVVFWFSRLREYRADKGGAELAGKEKMIGALVGLKTYINHARSRKETPAIKTLKIAHPTKSGLALLLSSHPSLEKRIERLKEIREFA